MNPLVLLCVFLLAVPPAGFSDDPQEVTVKPGENATLPCHAPRNAVITQLEWSRPDLKSDEYVLFLRNNHSVKNYQLLSFHGRVELIDRQLKDGDASVVLTNVSTNDTGTYQCRVFVSGRDGAPLISIITLKVEGGQPSEPGGVDVLLIVALVLIIACVICLVIGIVMCKKKKTASAVCQRNSMI